MGTEKTNPMSEVVEAFQKATANGYLAVGHFGSIGVPGNQTTWYSIRSGEDAISGLLSIPDYKVAQALAVLGSEIRLGILRILFGGPKTAAEVVTEMNFNTTGQAYYHLRELESAGYIEQRDGKWHFQMKVGRVYLAALNLAADAGAGRDDMSDYERSTSPTP